MKRLSRPCYDKAHRCPGWAGGGPKYPRGESRCDGGRINAYDYKGWWFGVCNKCNVVTLPYRTVKIAPSRAWWKLRQIRSRRSFSDLEVGLVASIVTVNALTLVAAVNTAYLYRL